MAIVRYLAMTGAEFCSCTQLPPHIGWLACHFSPSGSGLSNIPRSLPRGSLLLADDSLPLSGHDPELISRQLQQAINDLDAYAIVLDFQQHSSAALGSLSDYLQRKLPCPVFAPPEYSKAGPVFLPPCPLHIPVEAYLKPYHGRQILLDITPLSAIVRVTCEKASFQADLPQFVEEGWHWDQRLYCHYKISLQKDGIVFTLQRNKEAFDKWCDHVESLGITAMIGLYQEWK